MIKDFFVRIKGPHLFLSLIFLGLGVMVLAFGVKGYKEYSQREIKVTEAPARHDQNFSPEELQAMFGTSGDPAGNEFEVVAQQNLFSPDREAWIPPPANDQEEARPARTQRVNPKEFKLYGVTFAGDEKMALVHFQRLPENSRNRLVSEGDTVYQDRGGGEAVFRVASIGAESVTLEANGDSFEVGLFSHERQKIETSEVNQVSVVIGGADPDTRSGHSPAQTAVSESQQSPAASSSGSADITGQGSEETKSDVTSDDAPEDQEQLSRAERLKRLFEGSDQEQGLQMQPQEQDIQNLSNEDLERKVREGTMRKVDTPFGPAYRPVN